MEEQREPRGVFRKSAKTVADALRSVRDDNQIDQPTKEQIINFLSYLAVE